MTSTSYNFFDTLTLEIRGDEGRAVEQMREMYHHFAETSVENPDIVCEVTRTFPDPDIVFGDPDDYYGREGDFFVVQNGPNFMKINPVTGNIRMNPGMEPFYIVYIIEFALRKRLVDEERALVHASGVEMNGTTTLFPAWRGAGKTNTLLSLLAAGGDYLSDDRLWVGSDGSVQGYPLAVNMQPYNLKSFPDITLDQHEDTSIEDKVSDYIEENFEIGGSLFENGLVYLNKYYLKDAGRTFVTVDDMVPSANYVDTGDVDNVVILRAAPKQTDISIEPLSVSEAVTETTTISSYEWNARLREYFTALDSLFPNQNWAGELEDLIRAEERIFEKLYSGTDTYCASIPRERDWQTTGLRQQIVEQVRELSGRTPDTQVSSQH